MKQEYNTSNTEIKNALEVAVNSSFRSISPSYENTHSWYMSQKPVVRNVSVRSRFYMPVFSSAFAAVCAFVMILTSVQLHHQLSRHADVRNSLPARFPFNDEVAHKTDFR